MNYGLELTEQERHSNEQTAKLGHCWLLCHRAQAIQLLAKVRGPAEVVDVLPPHVPADTAIGRTAGMPDVGEVVGSGTHSA